MIQLIRLTMVHRISCLTLAGMITSAGCAQFNVPPTNSSLLSLANGVPTSGVQSNGALANGTPTNGTSVNTQVPPTVTNTAAPPTSLTGHSPAYSAARPQQPSANGFSVPTASSTLSSDPPPSNTRPSWDTSTTLVQAPAPGSGSRIIPTTPLGAPAPSTSPILGNPGGSFGGGSFGSGTLADPYATTQPYAAFQGPRERVADLVIQGFPARTGRIQLGGAVNSDAGITGQITIDERNFDYKRFPRSFRDLFGGTAFKGAGQTLRVEAAPGSDFQRYTINFVNPNIFNTPISASISGFLFDRRFDDWDEERLGGRLSFGYRITPDLSVNLGFSGQNVNIDTNRPGPQALTDVVGDNEFYSGEISLIHDTRNRPLQPSQGHYFQFSFEEAFGDFDYGRFETEFRQYWLVGERADGSGQQTLSFSTQLGFSGDETPIFENFFAGGFATIRGFDFRGASPVDVPTGVETGGRFQWLNSLEYIFPITADDAFRGVAFLDFGTVEENISIDSDNFRVVPGVGLRIAIPALGPAPLAFDFAFPVADADTDEQQTFSFYVSSVR